MGPEGVPARIAKHEHDMQVVLLARLLDKADCLCYEKCTTGKAAGQTRLLGIFRRLGCMTTAKMQPALLDLPAMLAGGMPDACLLIDPGGMLPVAAAEVPAGLLLLGCCVPTCARGPPAAPPLPADNLDSPCPALCWLALAPCADCAGMAPATLTLPGAAGAAGVDCLCA